MLETAEEIGAALRSGDGEAVAAALDALEFQRDIGEPVAVELPTADSLAPLGPELPDNVASRFVRVLDQYEDFSPAPERADVERQLALAAARFGPTSLGLEVSLVLKQSADPAASVEQALGAVAERGVRDDEVEYATSFVSYLLAGEDEVRSATVDVLGAWRERADLAPVVEGVVAELDDDEAERVGGT